MGSSEQQFCLRWNNHQSNLLNVFEELLVQESLVDVTLACDARFLKAHKVVLSACSPYFQALFNSNPCQHPIVILKDVKYEELQCIINFMYKGEVSVDHHQLGDLLKVAGMLQIKGLTEVTEKVFASGKDTEKEQVSGEKCQSSPSSPASKRRKRSKVHVAEESRFQSVRVKMEQESDEEQTFTERYLSASDREMENSKKKRSVNFSREEVKVLIDLVEKNKEIVENKKNDTASWKQKDATWEQISEELGESTGFTRDPKGLRMKYDQMKKLLRKKCSNGNEGPGRPVILDPVEEKLKRIMMGNVDGCESPSDADAAFFVSPEIEVTVEDETLDIDCPPSPSAEHLPPPPPPRLLGADTRGRRKP